MQMEFNKKNEDNASKPQAVKLQRYTITPFKGDFRDWSRFWNQFMVKVDGSKHSEISKFNCLLEYVQGSPKTIYLAYHTHQMKRRKYSR